jgi:hypothetical protein
LTDSKKSWVSGQFNGGPDGVYILRDLDATITDQGDFPQGWIDSNGKTTITLGETYAPTGNVTTDYALVGHRYEIWRVSICLDQPGQGKGALLSGSGPTGVIVSGAKLDDGSNRPTPYPANFQDYPQRGYPLEPSYQWNDVNLSGGAGTNAPLPLHAQDPQIQEGRDFFNNGSRPSGYPWDGAAPSSAGCPKDAVPSATVAPVPVTGVGGYTYPHPLTLDGGLPPQAPDNLKILP